MGLVISKGLTLRKEYIPIDTDAANYAMRVEAADGEPLEADVFSAINAFVLGCKQDGIWDAIKASCILAGARTRLGALTPLVGTAPTSFNFVDGDYNRKTGLVGNGNTKYLDSNRNNNADPQNSKHIAAYMTVQGNRIVMGVNTIASGGSWLSRNVDGTTSSMRANASTSYSYLDAFPLAPRLIGTSRSGASAQSHIAGLGLQTSTIASATPTNENIWIFRGINNLYGSHRLAFYSIGESLDLALLDARVTDLINAFAAAIP
jgi:hypothetical protein